MLFGLVADHLARLSDVVSVHLGNGSKQRWGHVNTVDGSNADGLGRVQLVRMRDAPVVADRLFAASPKAESNQVAGQYLDVATLTAPALGRAYAKRAVFLVCIRVILLIQRCRSAASRV